MATSSCLAVYPKGKRLYPSPWQDHSLFPPPHRQGRWEREGLRTREARSVDTRDAPSLGNPSVRAQAVLPGCSESFSEKLLVEKAPMFQMH